MNKEEKMMLKRLSRQDLLEMLIESEKKVEQLNKELDEAKKQLADRKILIENSGSIAEAALKLNGIFEAAQAAADQYLKNIGVPEEAAGEAAETVQSESQSVNAGREE